MTAPGEAQRIIAIDGPAASGKSTAARAVAGQLGFFHLNSGTLYRAIGWIALREGWPLEEESGRLDDRIPELEIELEMDAPDIGVRIEGLSPGDALKSGDVGEAASVVAKHATVRARTLDLLREAGARLPLVCDGRDIGTVVFPDASLKVYLVASPFERARRRLVEHGGDPTREAVEAEATRLLARDSADSSRRLSPLRPAEDAVQLDTTALSAEEVVGRIAELARDRGLVGDRGGS